jgi:hypothetical protein
MTTDGFHADGQSAFLYQSMTGSDRLEKKEYSIFSLVLFLALQDIVN